MNTLLPKFQIFVGKDGQFYFHLRSVGNHEIILSSTEGYKTKTVCNAGITSVRNHSPFDSFYIRKETNTSFGIRYLFTLKAANGEAIGKSELYNSIQNRANGIVP